jgi:hypothetical protein
MRLVHLSDLHLGFRAFPQRERGWNLRERDLASGFNRAIHEIARLRPGVVLVTGDLFDHPDPPSTAYLTLSRGFAALRSLLPQVTILAIAGERDTPFAPADPGPVAVVDALPGVEAAAGAARSVHLRAQRLHALLIPHRAIRRPPVPELRPDAAARWNVLLVRATPTPGEGSAELPQVRWEDWDYVAVGGPHAPRAYHPRVWSAGSLDRIGADPWREATEERGFVVFDLERGEGEFHPVPGRPVVDLAPIRADPALPEVGGRRLREVLDGVPGGVDGKILRVRIRSSAQRPDQALPPGLLRAVGRRAAYLEVQLESPEGPAPPRRSTSSVEDARTPRAVLAWDAGGAGQLDLHTGLWALVAEAGTDQAVLLQLLSRLEQESAAGGGEEGRRMGLALHLTQSGSDGRAARVAFDHVEPVAISPQIVPEPRADRSGWGAHPLPDPEGRAVQVREVRGDWVEAAGDLEARTLEWTRERQEAESRLLAYRDRARELKARILDLEAGGPDAPCPTCARPLSEAHPGLLELLREEWESLVQDGRWWKRRRDQLEDRPEEVRRLERKVHLLQSRMEAAMEGLLPEEGQPRSRADADPAAGGWKPELSTSVHEGIPVADEAVQGNVDVWAGEFLRRVTEGRIQAVRDVQGGWEVVGQDGQASPPDPLESLYLRAALFFHRLRTADRLPPVEVGLMTGLSRTGAESEAARFLELLPVDELPVPLLVAVTPELLERIPERFRGGLEFYRDAEGRPRFRTLPPGKAAIRLMPPQAPR